MSEQPPLYVVVNIGCIECGVSSDIVLITRDKATADAIAVRCEGDFAWREGGQNRFAVFEVAELERLNPAYADNIEQEGGPR